MSRRLDADRSAFSELATLLARASLPEAGRDELLTLARVKTWFDGELLNVRERADRVVGQPKQRILEVQTAALQTETRELKGKLP